MGTRFDRWLMRPSAICFLRRLLSTTGIETASPITSRRNVISWRRTSSTDCDPDAPDSEISRPREGQRYYSNKDITDRAPEIALQMSLNAGVAIINESAWPFRVYSLLSQPLELNASKNSMHRIMDKPEHRDNMKLWVEILMYRQRLDGFPGVLDVWTGIRQREIDLPVDGEEADTLWSMFIKSCIKHGPGMEEQRMLREVMQYVQDLKTRTGGTYRALHKYVVGSLFRINPKAAANFHRRLVADIYDDPPDLNELAEDCATVDSNQNTLRYFKAMYYSSKQRNLYDHYIPELLKHQSKRGALLWHKTFLENGDGPGAAVFATPEVQELFVLDDDRSLPMVVRKATTDIQPSQAAIDSSQLPALTRTSMSSLVGEVHGIKQKELSDPFVAKMFATRAFTLDLVINGLSFFGIDKLGPLALREMATRAASADECYTKLRDLKKMSIDVNGSVYGQLLAKVTTESPQLYDTLLASDMHPEAYEDTHTQEQLLDSYLEKGDRPNAYIVLLGLSVAGSEGNMRAWNRLMQHYILANDYQNVAQILDQMRSSRIVVSKRSLHFMHRHLLPTRYRSKAPSNLMPAELKGVHALQFTANAYIYAAEQGQTVHPAYWVEVLKRFGMLHKWDELERLVLWLAAFYRHGQKAHIIDNTGKIETVQIRSHIFTLQMRRAIFAWGFRSASVRRLLNTNFELLSKRPGPAPWTQGIVLLRNLRKCGIETSTQTVRAAFILRMWILFGPAHSKKGLNKDAIRDNRLSLADYVKELNEAWDEKLFDLDPWLLEPGNYPQLLIAIFGRFRRTARSRQGQSEYANVVAWARTLARGYRMPYSRNGRVRSRYWKHSPLRMVKSTGTAQEAAARSRSVSLAARSRLLPPQHPPPPAHSTSSYQPPNPQDTPEPA